MGRYFSRAAVALPLLLAASNIIAEEDVFKDAPGFYVELTGPKGETANEVRTINATPTVAAVSSRASAGTYGPLRSSDTMWSIASKVRPNRNVSVHQMMTAIYNKNPHAFLNNDINRLVNGAVLTIPSYAEISGVNKQNARDNFVASTQQTKPAKPVAPAVKPVAKPVPAIVKATPAPTPKPVEPVKTEVAQKPVEQTKPDTPSTAPNAVATGELDQLRTQLDDSNEQLLQVAESNQRMKVKLETLSEDFSSLKMQLQEDAKIQLEIKELLSQQLAKPAAVAETPANEPTDGLLKTISSSWLYLGALIALPILIILVILSFWLRAKTKKEAEEQEQEIATSTSTLMEEKSEFDELLATDADDLDDAKQPEPLYTLDDDLKADELTNANLANDDIDLMSEINLDSDDANNLDLDFSSIDNDDASNKLAPLDDINDDFNAKADDLDDDFGFDLADDIDLDDEPKTVSPEPAEPVFNPDELLSADDLENIEFEEADDALFELNEGNDLVQEEDMIVELNEEDDILLEELSPSAMDDDLVADLAPESKAKPVAEPAVETPKGATDLDEFDFNMADDDSPELAPEPVEIDAEDVAESADDNDLDWDFAEIDSDTDSKAKPEIAEVDDIDDNDLLASQLGEIAFNEPTTPADVPNAADVSDDYIDIERLLEESGDESTDEPYQGANFDLGLDDFPDVLPDADGIDVDVDEGGIGQKLDLARAYLEIDDKEGAKGILEEIQGQGSDDQIAEITKLLTRLG